MILSCKTAGGGVFVEQTGDEQLCKMLRVWQRDIVCLKLAIWMVQRGSYTAIGKQNPASSPPLYLLQGITHFHFMLSCLGLTL